MFCWLLRVCFVQLLLTIGHAFPSKERVLWRQDLATRGRPWYRNSAVDDAEPPPRTAALVRSSAADLRGQDRRAARARLAPGQLLHCSRLMATQVLPTCSLWSCACAASKASLQIPSAGRALFVRRPVLPNTSQIFGGEWIQQPNQWALTLSCHSSAFVCWIVNRAPAAGFILASQDVKNWAVLVLLLFFAC